MQFVCLFVCPFRPCWYLHDLYVTFSVCTVHLRSDLRRRDGDGRGLQEPTQTEGGHLPAGECRGLSGQSCCPLEPGHRHGAHPKTGGGCQGDTFHTSVNIHFSFIFYQGLVCWWGHSGLLHVFFVRLTCGKVN